MDLHWNYFLSLDSDLKKLSRYIEFDLSNYQTYSVELARIYLAASSECDVIFKLLCNKLNPSFEGENINHYRNLICQRLPELSKEMVFIARYHLAFQPFKEWSQAEYEGNPPWWKMHNKVKHNRDEYFKEANLLNALNSVAGLFVLYFFYKKLNINTSNPKEVTRYLDPQPHLFKLEPEYYYSFLIT